MNSGLAILGGIGLGAAAMYFFDPRLGRRRRALTRDRANRTIHQLEHGLDVAFRDIAHRAQGLKAEMRSAASSNHTAPDRVLVERIRARMGHCISHPHSINVTANDGQITLSGPVSQGEVKDLIACAAATPGVRKLDSHLDVHPGPAAERCPRNWSPGVRLLAATLGGGLMANCLIRRTPMAMCLGTVGFGLTLRAATNLDWTHLLGIGPDPNGVTVQKTITVDAPPEEVFRFWASYANFPRFMAHIQEVRDLGEGRSHWVATGPGGMPVSWNARITELVQNRKLAWQSERGSIIANAGEVAFDAVPEGTRIRIRLSYNPPGGALGHFAAMLFGADPRSAMNNDLVRLKSLIENGKASAPGKEARQKDVRSKETRPAADPMI